MNDPGTTGTAVAATTLLGDALPGALVAYYTALDSGRFDDAVDTFTADVLYAVPPSLEAVETAARHEIKGRDALRARFAARGAEPKVHVPQVCVVEGESCILEGITRHTGSGEVLATFVASAQLDADGAIRRYLAYQCLPAIDPPPGQPGGTTESWGDAAGALHRYFTALDGGRFEEAADCFSPDTAYLHPPYKHTGIDGGERVAFRSRDELLAAFRQRGSQSFDHRILVCGQRGPNCLLEGLVEGLPGGDTGSFISSLTLDPAGRIRRYLSFYCEPGVGRA